MIANFTAVGISGPTKTQQVHDIWHIQFSLVQPVFTWTDEWQDPHEGHPQQFNFDWQTFQNIKLP